MAKRGPKTKYHPVLNAVILRLAEEGKTNEQIAQILGINESTFYRWLHNECPELRKSIKEAGNLIDDAVEASLLSRCFGHQKSYPQQSTFQGFVTKFIETKYYPPDTQACIFWLKNRRPERWRDTAPKFSDEEPYPDVIAPED